MFRIKFPSLASPCVELVCIHATYQYNMQHAGCEPLSAVSLYTDAFVSGSDLDPNEHVILSDNLLAAYIHMKYHIDIIRYIARYRYRNNIYPESILDVDIDTSRKYRMIYREF